MDDIGNLNCSEYCCSNTRVGCFFPVSISERYDLEIPKRRASSVCETSWNSRISRSASCSIDIPLPNRVLEIWAGPLTPKNPCELNQQPSQQANLPEGCRIAEIAQPPPISRSLRRPTPPNNALTFHRPLLLRTPAGLQTLRQRTRMGAGLFYPASPPARGHLVGPRPAAAREQLTRQKASAFLGSPSCATLRMTNFPLSCLSP
jgi:hypothetical protein